VIRNQSSYMKTEIFALCDAATVHAGKLNILGTFDTIWAPSTPVIHQACAIAIKLRFETTELGNHPLRLVFVDADGKTLNQVQGAVNVACPPDADYSSVMMALGMHQIQLPQYGHYEMRLVVDNQEVAATPLALRPSAQPPAPPTAV
jgi:hypothetical protein